MCEWRAHFFGGAVYGRPRNLLQTPDRRATCWCGDEPSCFSSFCLRCRCCAPRSVPAALRKSPPMRARITHSPRQHRSDSAAPQASFYDVLLLQPPHPTGHDKCSPFSNFTTLHRRLVCPVGSMSLDLLRRVLMRDSCSRRLLLPGDEVRKCQLGSRLDINYSGSGGQQSACEGAWMPWRGHTGRLGVNLLECFLPLTFALWHLHVKVVSRLLMVWYTRKEILVKRLHFVF